MHNFLEICGKYDAKIPNTLYHYCTVDTMLKILQNHCIWLSDAEKTNDKTELKYFCEIMKDMLLRLLESYRGKFDSNLLMLVQSVLKKAIENIHRGSAYAVKNTKNYLCCFSESADLLSQWRAYGGNGQGVAIGFNAKLLSRINDMYHYDFVKVIYNNNTVFKNIEEDMREKLKYILESITDEELNPTDITFNLAPILTPILQERYPFKHPSFKEEREWRLFRKQMGNFDEDTGEIEPFFKGAFHDDDDIFECFSRSDLKFRSLQDDICSYFELGFEKCKKDIIKKIILGPKCQIDERDLKILLRKYMYINDVDSNEIKIQKSQNPYV